MKPVHACCSRVEVKASPRLHALDQQNVAVSTDKHIGSCLFQLGKYTFGVGGRASAYMRHPNVETTCFKVLIKRPFRTNIFSVNVAIDRAALRDFLQLIGHCEVSDVTRVPNLIRTLHVLQHAIIQMAMGVRKERNVHRQ